MSSVTLLVVLMAATAAATNAPKLEVRLVGCSMSTVERTCASSDSLLQTAVKQTAEKTLIKPGTAARDLLKDVRPRTCRTTTSTAPSTSWPARGDAAVSFCRP
jgi:hypothetical protein